MRFRSAPCVALVLAVGAGPAGAQFFSRGGNFTGAISVDVPSGDLASAARSGLGVLVRAETNQSGPWSLRTGLSFDRFSGKGSIDNLQFFTLLGGELVHRSGTRWYQYAGFGFYQSRTIVRPQPTVGGTAAPPATDRLNDFFDFGFQAGVGINYTLADTKTFVEFGFVNVLTIGPTSVWFPVRFGIRL
ncbi:MAG TPA: hypothetical protein VHE78_00560 [Gemmatimonadaceae bacterium]|nr:hypothetical protein [Gemmatimonadaceae bacterium]